MNALQRLTWWLSHRLLLYLCPVLMFGLGLWRFGDKYGSQELREGMQSLRSLLWMPALTVEFFWSLFLAIPVLLLLLAIEDLFRRDTLVLDTEAGHPLKIRREAVCRFVRERLQEIPFVHSVKVRARATGGALALRIRITVKATESLDNMQSQVRERVVEKLRRGLGMTELIEPDIEFVAVREQKGGKQEASASEVQEEKDAPPQHPEPFEDQRAPLAPLAAPWRPEPSDAEDETPIPEDEQRDDPSETPPEERGKGEAQG